MTSACVDPHSSVLVMKTAFSRGSSFKNFPCYVAEDLRENESSAVICIFYKKTVNTAKSANCSLLAFNVIIVASIVSMQTQLFLELLLQMWFFSQKKIIYLVHNMI